MATATEIMRPAYDVLLREFGPVAPGYKEAEKIAKNPTADGRFNSDTLMPGTTPSKFSAVSSLEFLERIAAQRDLWIGTINLQIAEIGWYLERAESLVSAIQNPSANANEDWEAVFGDLKNLTGWEAIFGDLKDLTRAVSRVRKHFNFLGITNVEKELYLGRPEISNLDLMPLGGKYILPLKRTNKTEAFFRDGKLLAVLLRPSAKAARNAAETYVRERLKFFCDMTVLKRFKLISDADWYEFAGDKLRAPAAVRLWQKRLSWYASAVFGIKDFPGCPDQDIYDPFRFDRGDLQPPYPGEQLPDWQPTGDSENPFFESEAERRIREEFERLNGAGIDDSEVVPGTSDPEVPPASPTPTPPTGAIVPNERATLAELRNLLDDVGFGEAAQSFTTQATTIAFDAYSGAIDRAIDTGDFAVEGFGVAIRSLAVSTTKSLGQRAAVEGAFEFGKGIAAAADRDESASAHFGAAGKFFAIAAAAGVATGIGSTGASGKKSKEKTEQPIPPAGAHPDGAPASSRRRLVQKIVVIGDPSDEQVNSLHDRPAPQFSAS